MSLSASRSGITLPALGDDVASIDVRFDGARVWSVTLGDSNKANKKHLRWPPELAKHLTGTTELSLHNSADGSLLASTEVSFDIEEHRTSVVDANGTPLAVNKWGRLGKTLEGSDLHERILERTTELIEVLESLGLRPFVVGGTLLGAVREGRLLPHDDDADIAYLSHHTGPTDVAVEGFEVGRKLEELGYTLTRHSATHMQLQFQDSPETSKYYVDVFAAFFTDDGHINQPFHVRGPFRHDQMLPFGTVDIGGAQTASTRRH